MAGRSARHFVSGYELSDLVQFSCRMTVVEQKIPAAGGVIEDPRQARLFARLATGSKLPALAGRRLRNSYVLLSVHPLGNVSREAQE
jgi:hypothetical protein